MLHGSCCGSKDISVPHPFGVGSLLGLGLKEVDREALSDPDDVPGG